MARLKSGDVIWLDVPRRVVLQLWWCHQIDAAGIWLIDHGHWRMAARLWRIRL